MKFVSPSHFADPDAAARKLVEIANAAETVQDGRIYIELINGHFLKEGGTPNRAALARATTLLAVAARIRDLCEVHACRCRAVRLMAAKGRQRLSTTRFLCRAVASLWREEMPDAATLSFYIPWLSNTFWQLLLSFARFCCKHC
jgi:hypothetical protein